MNESAQKGFTLVELLVVLGVIGILTGIAIPTYHGYQKSMSRSKINLHFKDAVHFTKNTFAKNDTDLALGRRASRPANAAEWLALYLAGGGKAPGGGPAYVAGNTGEATGAIGVDSNEDGSVVVLYRPAYDDMTLITATVDAVSVLMSDS
ncbi:MAG: hypothetical protein CMQ49_08155 [Gammaproteobacteria bacterium]|nr:hypothetical protein [Gammaproteobacteria bacterium]|tara:strand:+ start:1347 stop:1796 length:450 start_codon:yes stop_codon:yes gene_type:complete